jgi:hypothetical protein
MCCLRSTTLPDGRSRFADLSVPGRENQQVCECGRVDVRFLLLEPCQALMLLHGAADTPRRYMCEVTVWGAGVSR